MLNRIKKYFNKDQQHYLIYTMGKVGSTSIYNSFKEKYPYLSIHHTHFLSDYWLKERLPSLDPIFHYNIKQGLELRKIIENTPIQPLKIITLTREPIIRELSDLFQNWKHLYDDIEEVSEEELSKKIETSDFEYTLQWFDTELNNYLDFDLYAQHFDREKGYAIYKEERFELLCIKLEALNSVWDQAMLEFSGYSVPLKTANTSEAKKGKAQYTGLRERIKIDARKLETLYSSNYMTHFYTPSEIENYRTRWEKEALHAK